MKLAVLILVASAAAPVESSRLRRGDAADAAPGVDDGSEPAIAGFADDGDDPDRGAEDDGRGLLSPWCPDATPVMWHPNYAVAWSASGCVLTRDCNSPGYDTQLACCRGQYGGQVSRACIAGLAAPPTNAPTDAAGGGGGARWYADYATSWPNAGCKTETPYPIYATVFYESELACCRGAYGGQTSGACLAGLPNPPTGAPTNAGGVAAARWYADYATPWPIAGCKSETPYPIYASTFYESELLCCKGAYGGQTSGACLAGLPNPPTKIPTAQPTPGAGGRWYADYGTAWADAGCKDTLPLPIYTIATYASQLECCRAAYGGQTSNACIRGLPNPPTRAPTARPTPRPTAAAGAGMGRWYADYGTAWADAGCKDTLPLPIYTIATFASQLECCRGAYGGQTSNACIRGLPNPPTRAPTAQPTPKPTAQPTSKPTAAPTATPTSNPTATPTSAPTTAKPA